MLLCLDDMHLEGVLCSDDPNPAEACRVLRPKRTVQYVCCPSTLVCCWTDKP